MRQAKLREKKKERDRPSDHRAEDKQLKDMKLYFKEAWGWYTDAGIRDDDLNRVLDSPHEYELEIKAESIEEMRKLSQPNKAKALYKVFNPDYLSHVLSWIICTLFIYHKAVPQVFKTNQFMNRMNKDLKTRQHKKATARADDTSASKAIKLAKVNDPFFDKFDEFDKICSGRGIPEEGVRLVAGQRDPRRRAG